MRPVIFETLAQLLSQSIYTTLAEAMQRHAERGRLAYLSTAGLRWFSELTVCSVQQPDFASKAVRAPWVLEAHMMLQSLRPAASTAVGAMAEEDLSGAEGGGMRRVGTYITLGDAIGEGASSVVVQAQAHRLLHAGCSAAERSAAASASGDRDAETREPQLAVKMVRHGGTADGTDNQERLAMWELHVLRQLSDPHIVRVRDVIELVDATYIVMERVDGPELGEYIDSQPEGRLPAPVAARFFGQLLCALRHAHRRGFLHCDVKPENIRLNLACDRVVLTDWGFARRMGDAPCRSSWR